MNASKSRLVALLAMALSAFLFGCATKKPIENAVFFPPAPDVGFSVRNVAIFLLTFAVIGVGVTSDVVLPGGPPWGDCPGAGLLA